MDKMTQPDQNPPPRTMSNEISREAIERFIDVYLNEHACNCTTCQRLAESARAEYSTLKNDSYELTSFKAGYADLERERDQMRDELERVKGELADMRGIELDDKPLPGAIGRLIMVGYQTGAIDLKLCDEANAELADQSAKMASLESQAGAMREALKQTQYERNGSYLFCPECHNSEIKGHAENCSIWKALNGQAGADQSARVQAFNDLKLRHERLAVAARALWDAIPDYDWNFIAKDDGETDRAISEATNKLHAALSQEQATTRNG